MTDDLARACADLGEDPDIRALLARVCARTGMGFAAVAYVTDTRWIACQVDDRVAFGLNPGDELEIKKTICDEIRDSGQRVVIDDTDADPNWSSHPVPKLYGFHSYVSLPLMIDGRFFGTLCALDDAPRAQSLVSMLDELEAMAAEMAQVVQRRLPPEFPGA